MSEENNKAWKQNLHGKCQEIKHLIDECLKLLPDAKSPAKKDEFIQKLSLTQSKTSATCHLFASNLVPSALASLVQTLKQLENNVGNPSHIRNLVLLQAQLDQIPNEGHAEISFTKILDKHKDDEELQKHLDGLIQALEKLLDEGDDELSNQVATRLSKILSEIERRRKQTLFDLDPWVEWALISLGSIYDSYSGLPLGATIATGLLAAKKSKVRISDLVRSAKSEYFTSLDLKEFSPEAEKTRNPLLQTSVQELEDALKPCRGGIKALLGDSTTLNE